MAQQSSGLGVDLGNLSRLSRAKTRSISPENLSGEKGQGGSETLPNKGFYAAAGEPKQIWEVPNGQHIAGITTEPAEYEQRVIGFFDKYLQVKS